MLIELNKPLCKYSALDRQDGQSSDSGRPSQIVGRCVDSGKAADASDAQMPGDAGKAHGRIEMQVRYFSDSFSSLAGPAPTSSTMALPFG